MATANTTIDVKDGPDEAVRQLDHYWAWNHSLFERVITQGQSEGSFRDDIPAAELADMLTRMMIGTAVMSRQNPGAGQALTDRALTLLTPIREA